MLEKSGNFHEKENVGTLISANQLIVIYVRSTIGLEVMFCTGVC